jgi:hypothetical protein
MKGSFFWATSMLAAFGSGLYADSLRHSFGLGFIVLAVIIAIGAVGEYLKEAT